MDLTARHSQIDDAARMAKVLVSLGVENGFPELQHSEVTPERCMAAASDSLWFMGSAGSKWRDDPWFRKGLQRFSQREGEVLFLVSLRTSDEGLKILMELQASFADTLHVRVSPYPPLFRLIVIDHERMVLSHYGHEVVDDNDRNARGWRSPQLVLRKDNEWSLFTPFKILFTRFWTQAIPIADYVQMSTTERRRLPIIEGSAAALEERVKRELG